MKNKTYAVKRNNIWWSAIDCGETKKGGMATENFFLTHFRKDDRTYRWYKRIIDVTDDLEEWTEIDVKEVNACLISTSENDMKTEFSGWEDSDDLVYQTLSKFASILGKELSQEEVKNLIFEYTK